jgi:uncharacterized protein
MGNPDQYGQTAWARSAVQLTSADWHALVADKRTQVIITPLVGFMNVGVGEAIELAEDINDRLDEAAENIPHSILLLKKIAQLRASRNNPVRPTRPAKTGRNDPCPCGSGQKFKRCCGRN